MLYEVLVFSRVATGANAKQGSEHKEEEAISGSSSAWRRMLYDNALCAFVV